MRRTWTTGDLREVERLAGTMPASEIRKRMRLSSRQLRYACELLRAQGRDVSLRYWESSLEVCPSCGHMRSTMDGSGICEPCRLARRLSRTDAAISGLLDRLPPEQRRVYARTEAELESSMEPLPPRPSTKGLDSYERARAEEEHELEVERVTTGNLRRRLKAAQRRKERIERKVSEEERRRNEKD
jgi:hypothetical protein